MGCDAVNPLGSDGPFRFTPGRTAPQTVPSAFDQTTWDGEDCWYQGVNADPCTIPCWYKVVLSQQNGAAADDPMSGTYYLHMVDGDIPTWGTEWLQICGVHVTLTYTAFYNYGLSAWYYCPMLVVGWEMFGTNAGSGSPWIYRLQTGYAVGVTSDMVGVYYETFDDLMAAFSAGTEWNFLYPEGYNGTPPVDGLCHQVDLAQAIATALLDGLDEPGCCERRGCGAQFIRQLLSESVYYQPCCLALTWHGVKPGELTTCRPGYAVDMAEDDPDEYPYLNPTVNFRRTRCQIGDTIPTSNYYMGEDNWASRPATCLTPFPTQLTITGTSDTAAIEIDGNYFMAYAFAMTLIGEEPIVEEGVPSRVAHTIAYKADLPGRMVYEWDGEEYPEGYIPYPGWYWAGTFPDPCGAFYVEWYGPPLTPADLEGITLEYDAENSSPDDASWRGPDYTNSTVTIAQTSILYDACNNFTTCELLDAVWGWTLQTTDLRGDVHTITLRKTDTWDSRWRHGLIPWELFVEPEERDAACGLRLLYSCAKWGWNYGFCFPPDFDPCDPYSPENYVCSLVDAIPLPPVDRYAYLQCGFMPGSAIVLTPLCEYEDLGDNKEVSIIEDTSTCAATAWTVTISGESGVDGEYSVSFYDQGPDGGYWHYPENVWPDADNPPPLFVDVVRIADDGANTRYVVVVSVWNVGTSAYVSYWAEWTNGTDCCADDPHSLDLLDSAGADSGYDVVVEAVC